MKKAILRYQWKYASLTKYKYFYEKKWNMKVPLWYRVCRNYWLPLGIFFFLWFFISPVLLKGLDSPNIHNERLEEEKSSQTTVVDTAGFPSTFEINLRDRENDSSLIAESVSQSRMWKERTSYWSNEEGIEVFLFVAVASAPECEKRRSTIRATWSQYFQNAQFPIDTQSFNKNENMTEDVISSTCNIRKRPLWHMLFFIGRSSNPKVQQRVEEEARVFRDVILLPYQEGYYNLTLKTLAMFQWASQYVRSSFVFKADDDVYLHIPRLIEWLEECPKSEFYSGHGSYDKKPIREPITHKWYISEEEYPYTYFPDYCNGNGYVMSMDLVHRVASCFPQDWSCSWMTEKMQDVQDASFRKEAYKRCRQSLANDCGMYIKFEDVTIGSILLNYNEAQAMYNESMIRASMKKQSFFSEKQPPSPPARNRLRCRHEPRIINEPEAVRQWGGLVKRSRCREDFIMIHRVRPAQMWRYFYTGMDAKMCDEPEFYPDPVSHLKQK
ncbi:hypothetical protein GpartN1_g3879.t1 [Galdieria partita]|uniref:Hexosyltransferase n=1 Tax=Galdieria partita TaxID=83374 RepID=A0A9C7PWH4_9RHOD|nr:hypothetical protein GpartN1_g3879.t1 [Galdieria partita]